MFIIIRLNKMKDQIKAWVTLLEIDFKQQVPNVKVRYNYKRNEITLNGISWMKEDTVEKLYAKIILYNANYRNLSPDTIKKIAMSAPEGFDLDRSLLLRLYKFWLKIKSLWH